MPPGNNNAKPARRGKCTYCRKDSCRGDNCTVNVYEGVCGNTIGSQLRYSSVTSSASSTIGRGIVVTSGSVQQPLSTLQQSNATSTRISTAVPTTSGTVVSRVPSPLSSLQQSNATSTKISTAVPITSGTVVSRVPSPLSSLQQSNATSTRISTVIPTTSGTAVARVPQPLSTVKPLNADFKVDVGKMPLVSKQSSCASIISKNSSNSDLVDKIGLNKLKSHSKNALKYEGVVYQILGTRNAKVRVAERNGIPLQKSEWGAADAEHKFALLLVDKVKQDDHESFYPTDTPISSVLNKGDLVVLICTAHNKSNNTFQLFAHEARRTGLKIQVNNDADSVASYCSQTGSDTQESAPVNTKKNRNRRRKVKKKEAFNGDSYDVSDAVNQWLDTSGCLQNKNETLKTLKLIAGCPYIGKVIEMRLPYAFIVEVSSKDGKQLVFVFSSHFHLQGISSPAMAHGVSLESFVNIGDEIVVIPNKNAAMQENKFEWIASKAWPKTIQSPALCNLPCLNKYELLTNPEEKLSQQGDAAVIKDDQDQGGQSLTYLGLYPLAKNCKELEGVILSLQYDWGLVKEAVGSQSAYVFTRKNTYFYGVCLKHFILDDLLEVGQLVKFSMETEENGAMNALAVWYGNKFPDFNSFDIAAVKYCEEREISFSTEDSLIRHGKLFYLEQ